MNRAQATKLWEQALEGGSPEERFPILKRLEKAKPKDVIELASKGRRRFDRDATDNDGDDFYLFAAKREGNRLIDVVEIAVHRQIRITSIELISEKTIVRTPEYYFVKQKCLGQSGIAVGGWQHYLSGRVGSGLLIPELDKAIPRPATYKRGSFEFHCFWTAEDAVAIYGDWITRIQSKVKARRFDAIRKPPSFSFTEFTDEARSGLGRLISPAVLEAFADADEGLRSGALKLIDEFKLKNADSQAIAEGHRLSNDAARREAAYSFADYGDVTPDDRLRNIERKLADPDRDIRFSVLRDLRAFGFTLGGQGLNEIIEGRIAVEPDREIKEGLTLYRLVNAPLREPFVSELCALIEQSDSDELRRLAFTRLRQDEGAHPIVAKTALVYFDCFPVLAADILVPSGDYSRAAKARMVKLVDDPDWSLRWRLALYLDHCPTPSAAMLKLVERLQNDKEYTVRESAKRATKAIKRRLKRQK